jgi:hypothetical protein
MSKIPANREKNSEFRKFRQDDTILRAGTRVNSKACSTIPCVPEQGIPANNQGNLQKDQGSIAACTRCALYPWKWTSGGLFRDRYSGRRVMKSAVNCRAQLGFVFIISFSIE